MYSKPTRVEARFGNQRRDGESNRVRILVVERRIAVTWLVSSAFGIGMFLSYLCHCY